MTKADQPETRRRRTPRPLTAEQQALCVRNHARAMKLAVEEENKHTGANGYYAHGLDVTGVAEEMLVVAARGYDPEHERANFDGYLRRCIERGLVKEYRKNEKYMRGNYDPWIIRELHEGNAGKSTDVLLKEKEIALQEVCKKLDEECDLRVKAADVLRTISHELSLSVTAEQYRIPVHVLRYEQKKVITAIKKSKELSDSIKFALTETEERPSRVEHRGKVEKQNY